MKDRPTIAGGPANLAPALITFFVQDKHILVDIELILDDEDKPTTWRSEGLATSSALA